MSDDTGISGGDSGYDSVTEVTTIGWGSRLLGSIVGALFGIVLVIVAIWLLWWNEGRELAALRGLDQGMQQIAEAAADRVDPALANRLVHLSGPMQSRTPVRDPAFGVGGDDLLRLRRIVEMYQWTEHKTTATHRSFGGAETTETTYSYRKEWAEHPVEASRFHEANGHYNPPMPLASALFDAVDARLGAYRIDGRLLGEVEAFADYHPVPAALPAGYRQDGDMFYRGQDAAAPAIGDIRVHYRAVTSQTMSVVAAQQGEVLAPYRSPGGYQIALAEPGSVPAPAMFREKQFKERLLTWILRLFGLVLTILGLALIANPVSVLAGIVPLFGDMVGAGIVLLAVMVGVPLTLLVIAAAWIGHRPLVGGLLVAAAAVAALLLRRWHRARAAARNVAVAPAAAGRVAATPQPAPATPHFLPPEMLDRNTPPRGP